MSASLRVRALAAAACLLLVCAGASASPGVSAGPWPRIVGVTVDDLSRLPAVLDSLRSLPRRPWVRVVFDVHSSRPADPSSYVRPVGQLAAVGPVLGELVDSGALRSMTVLQVAARAAAYVRALRSSVAVWEVGNEVNGDWTGTPSDVARKVQVAYDTVHRLRGRTALTLYENEGCGDGPRELSPVAWAERYLPARVRSGLDNVLLSYYDPKCKGWRPSSEEWTRRFVVLRRLFPRARVGFGEVGLPKAATPSTRATAASIIAYYYGLRIALPYFVGGGVYWYFAEDMVPRSGSLLWPALAQAWSRTGARLRQVARASTDIAPPSHAGFSYQIGGPFAPAPGVGVVDRDRHAAPAPGTYGICYVNGFQAQPEELVWWRARYPSLLLRRDGRAVIDTNWNEQLLDISTAAKRRSVATIVGAWIRSCARAGYRAVELDNLDSFARSRGALTAADDLALAPLLIARAHAAGLAIAQKNGAELARTGRRLGFDFAIAEECQAYDECGRYLGAYGDRVIEVEYPDNGGERNFDRACRSQGKRISIVYRDRAVTPAGRPGFIERRCPVTAGVHVYRAGPAPARHLTLGAAAPTPVAAPAPRVAGARLVDAHGRLLLLRGVNFSGAQYECLDDRRVWDVPADARALAGLRRWRVNAVRLPLNEDCWLGINGKPLASRRLATAKPSCSGSTVSTLTGSSSCSTCMWPRQAPKSLAPKRRWPTPTTARRSGRRSLVRFVATRRCCSTSTTSQSASHGAAGATDAGARTRSPA